ncbi:hypothetical protein JAAARDRAFT_49675 [Jaapia argillacea MUCL 33604]|uniref:Uncharacterized protein n=1 Tax=Jaapia argillacea MUCL 33604 TaxID=933084 RepID=A0A067PQ81_9AGAM|nr:hypothetical protein JAAARDRAFT_49675 [Jaapia argillacea MUCL 33604]
METEKCMVATGPGRAWPRVPGELVGEKQNAYVEREVKYQDETIKWWISYWVARTDFEETETLVSERLAMGDGCGNRDTCRRFGKLRDLGVARAVRGRSFDGELQGTCNRPGPKDFISAKILIAIGRMFATDLQPSRDWAHHYLVFRLPPMAHPTLFSQTSGGATSVNQFEWHHHTWLVLANGGTVLPLLLLYRLDRGGPSRDHRSSSSQLSGAVRALLEVLLQNVPIQMYRCATIKAHHLAALRAVDQSDRRDSAWKFRLHSSYRSSKSVIDRR